MYDRRKDRKGRVVILSLNETLFCPAHTLEVCSDALGCVVLALPFGHTRHLVRQPGARDLIRIPIDGVEEIYNDYAIIL